MSTNAKPTKPAPPPEVAVLPAADPSEVLISFDVRPLASSDLFTVLRLLAVMFPDRAAIEKVLPDVFLSGKGRDELTDAEQSEGLIDMVDSAIVAVSALAENAQTPLLAWLASMAQTTPEQLEAAGPDALLDVILQIKEQPRAGRFFGTCVRLFRRSGTKAS